MMSQEGLAGADLRIMLDLPFPDVRTLTLALEGVLGAWWWDTDDFIERYGKVGWGVAKITGHGPFFAIRWPDFEHQVKQLPRWQERFLKLHWQLQNLTLTALGHHPIPANDYFPPGYLRKWGESHERKARKSRPKGDKGGNMKQTEKPLSTEDMALLALWVALTNQGAMFTLPKDLFGDYYPEVVLQTMYMILEELLAKEDLNRLRNLIERMQSVQDKVSAKCKERSAED